MQSRFSCISCITTVADFTWHVEWHCGWPWNIFTVHRSPVPVLPLWRWWVGTALFFVHISVQEKFYGPETFTASRVQLRRGKSNCLLASKMLVRCYMSCASCKWEQHQQIFPCNYRLTVLHLVIFCHSPDISLFIMVFIPPHQLQLTLAVFVYSVSCLCSQ